MPETICRACPRPTHNGNLCTPCTRRLEEALAELPALLAELNVNVARQDVSNAPLYGMRRDRLQIPGVHYEEGDTTLPGTPWPLGWDAANVHWSSGNTIGTWARELARQTPTGPACEACTHRSCAFVRAAASRSATALLLASVDWIAGRPDAGQIVDEITYAHTSILAAIDNPDPDVFLGTCDSTDATVTDHDGTLIPEISTCGADLLGRTGDEQVRCPRCHTVYDVAGRNEQLLERVNDEWAPAQAIADALTTRDEPVNASTLRTWIDRDKRAKAAGRVVDYPLIVQVGLDDDGRTALYRVGDVRARIAWSKARRERITA